MRRPNVDPLAFHRQLNATHSPRRNQTQKLLIQLDIPHGLVPPLRPFLSSAISVMPHVKAGKLRGLGVTTPKRAPSLPDLPAIAESVPGYDVSPWYGVLVPAGTPRAIVGRLHEEIARIVGAQDVAQRLTGDGGSIVSAGSTELANVIKQERATWSKVIKAAHTKLE